MCIRDRYLAAVAAALAGRWLFKEKFAPGAVGGCGTLLAVQLMLSVSGLSTPAAAMGTLGDALLAAGTGWALRQSGKERALAAGPLSGTAFLLGLAALPALAAAPAGPLNLGVAALGAAGLAFAYRGRLRDCALLTVAGGAVLAAADPALCFACLGLAAGCLAAAYFTPGEKLGSGAVFRCV